MWPKAKRGVSDEVARSIATAAQQHGATPVGVFVDEDAATINRRQVWGGRPQGSQCVQGSKLVMVCPGGQGSSLLL